MNRAITAAAAVASIACIAFAAGSAAGAVREVDFRNAGDTYDPASLRVVGDRTINVKMAEPRAVGGILLTAVGTMTSISGLGRDASPGIRGFMPRVYKEMIYDDGGDYVTETLTMCGAGGGYLAPARVQRPRGNGVWQRVKWTWYGCSGDPERTPIFRVADGETKYTVSNFKRIRRPAVYRTYREGSDGYFNVCLTADHIGDIVQRNGVRQCTVLVRSSVDRVAFRLRQTTKITRRYPAYVCPGGTGRLTGEMRCV